MIKFPKISVEIQNPTIKFIVKIVGYLFVFLFAFIFFIYQLFPYNRWKNEAEEIISQYIGKHVTIEKIKGWGLTGIELKGVGISSEKSIKEVATAIKNKNADEEPETKKEIDKKSPVDKVNTKRPSNASNTKNQNFRIDSVKIKPYFLALITGSTGAVFKIKMLAGEIGGKIKIGKKSSLRISIEDINMNNLTFIEETIGLPFIGEINGNIKIDFPGKNYQESKGMVKIKISNMQIGETGGKLNLEKAGGGI
ncbi:MAG: type II secretion system protein GspN, partial [Candidatus Omnitrophica bacterium]|nr:type II secretion system protein GspN [Candidatus Omnitrophota bacterium]